MNSTTSIVSPDSRIGRRFDVLSVSDMCVDMILYGNVRPEFRQIEQIIDDYVLDVGGSANIFISQLSKLGANAGVIGWVGQDNFGGFLRSKLKAIGVDINNVKTHPSAKTGIGVALTEKHDRAILTYPGTIDATMPADLDPAMLSETRHWHIASFFLLQKLRPHWKDWLLQCKNAGVTTSFDTNWDPDDRWEGVLDLLPFIDVFLPNEAEASRLTGERDTFDAAERLASAGNLIVVKKGAKGAIARKGQQIWQLQPDQQSMEIADSIGAGDNFDAGFVYGQLIGWTVDDCLALGHRCAVASLLQPGGIRGQLVAATSGLKLTSS